MYGGVAKCRGRILNKSLTSCLPNYILLELAADLCAREPYYKQP